MAPRAEKSLAALVVLAYIAALTARSLNPSIISQPLQVLASVAVVAAGLAVAPRGIVKHTYALAMSIQVAILYWLVLFAFTPFTGLAVNGLAPTLTLSLTMLVLQAITISAKTAALVALKYCFGATLKLLLPVSILVYTFDVVTVSEIVATKTLLQALSLTVNEVMPRAVLALSTAVLVAEGEVLTALVFTASMLLPAYALPVLPNVSPWLASILAIAASLSLTLLVLGETREEHASKSLVKDILLPFTVGAMTIALLVFGIKPLVVVSSSMEPTFKPGDVVIVVPIRLDEVSVGDIIAYVKPGYGIVVHRVIDFTRDDTGKVYLITKGDANRAPDPPVNPRHVVGKVITRIPYVGAPLLQLYKLLEKIQQVFHPPDDQSMKGSV